MKSLETLRRAHEESAARVEGSRLSAPSLNALQRAARPHHAEIMALPDVLLAPIQEQDPASASFGAFLFMLGAGGLGDEPLGGG